MNMYSTLRKIVEANEKIIDETKDTIGCISFEFNGTSITNPFADESSINSVDPIEYYGKAFLESKFMKDSQ